MMERLKEGKEPEPPKNSVLSPSFSHSGGKLEDNKSGGANVFCSQIKNKVYGDISEITPVSPNNGPSLDSSMGRDINDLLDQGTGKKSVKNL